MRLLLNSRFLSSIFFRFSSFPETSSLRAKKKFDIIVDMIVVLFFFDQTLRVFLFDERDYHRIRSEKNVDWIPLSEPSRQCDVGNFSS